MVASPFMPMNLGGGFDTALLANQNDFGGLLTDRALQQLLNQLGADARRVAGEKGNGG